VIWGLDLVGNDGPIMAGNALRQAQGGIVQPGAEVCRRRDLNPTGGGDKDGTDQDEERTVSAQIGPGSPNSKSGKGQKGDRSGQKKPISRQKKCDLCVTCEKIPEDLRRVITAWGGLSEKERRRILDIIEGQ